MPNFNYCAQCGAKLESGSRFCSKCGANQSQDFETRIIKKSNKSALIALLLCLFLGPLGIHRFYVGKIGTGILMLLTVGGFGIWSLIDLIRIAWGDFTDSDGNYLELMKSSTSTFKKTLLIVGLVIASFILFVICIFAIALYATSGVTNTVRSQLNALRSGDYVKAYSYTSKDFQNSTSFDAFKIFIDRHPSLKNNKSSTFTSRKIENSEGEVSGTLEATDGTTTPVQYRLIKENDHWKILSIRISPSGIVEKTDARRSQSAPGEIALPNIFESSNSKYSIHYPADWEYTQPDKATVVISGKKGTPSYVSTVNIQTVLTKKSGGNYSTLKEFMNSLKKQALQIAPDTKILAEDAINLDKKSNRMAMQGRYVVFSYTYKGHPIRQMQFIFLRDDGQVFYTWGYTSPINRFDIDYPIAKAMFTTWSVY